MINQVILAIHKSSLSKFKKLCCRRISILTQKTWIYMKIILIILRMVIIKLLEANQNLINHILTKNKKIKMMMKIRTEIQYSFFFKVIKKTQHHKDRLNQIQKIKNKNHNKIKTTNMIMMMPVILICPKA